ncbi:MAG: hypothetical protein JXB29_02435 [Sedimentisphaerales bacterium]|nr:hypothetical protein [Sedimentisphaerales bacterium]
MTNTAPTPAQLEDLLKQNLVILPDSNFENLPSDLKENEIIFLGEYEHRSRPLSLAASKLAVYLASHRPVVYALESRYGSHPLFEAVSLGKEKATIDPMLYPEAIQAFNSSQTADKKILLTAIDIEHTIYHTKSYTVHFLQELAQRSTSDVARRIIQNHIPQLTTQDTFDKVNRYLEELKGVFLQHLGTFSPEDQDEILFSLDLLQASNQFYQYISDWRIRRFYLTPRGWNIRAQYFKKTIERAYHKAQRRKAILLCRVGAPHASLTDKYYEALYFAKKYSPTKGKVVSIGLVPVYYNIRETNDNVTGKHNDIDSIVKILMKGDECSYLSLSKLQENTNNSFKWSKYYSNSGPKYDGLLFVKIEKSSN